MGIDITSKLIVGLEFKDIKDWLEEKLEDENIESDNIYELLEELDLDHASPWYDSAVGNWFIGIQVKGYGDYLGVIQDIEQAVFEFKIMTGLDPIVNSIQHVY